MDTFPAFLAYWEKARDLSLDEQIEGWAGDYLSPWPDLLALQIEDYQAQSVDWREIARERIFPSLHERLPAMQLAHENLLAVGGSVYERALERLRASTPAMFVIHVGIGCGAGWATRLRGSPAVLFGLENIAESGWQERDALSGLVAHELGHLVHHAWREAHPQPVDAGPWWQLYEEGFAQYCEALVLESRTWHQMHNEPGWLDWCQSNRGWLAGEFLRRVAAGEGVTPFFGSWHDLCGQQQTGYYLGYEAVQRLAGEQPLREIALLEDPEPVLRTILEEIAAGKWTGDG